MLTAPENLEMVRKFKETMPEELYLEFGRRNGTDQMLCFYLHWRALGYKRGSISRSWVRAEYSPTGIYTDSSTLTRHPAIVFIYDSMERDDLAFITRITNLFFKNLEKDIDSKDQFIRVKCYPIWQKWMDKHHLELKEALQRVEKLQRLLTQKKLTPQDMPLEELLLYRDDLDRIISQKQIETN